MANRQLKALVTTEIFTPYKAGEIFYVDEPTFEKLLKPDRTQDLYGRPRYPKVKVRPFDASNKADLRLLLDSHTLNQADHNALLKKIDPDAVMAAVSESQFESEVSNLLDELNPERKKSLSDLKKEKKEKEARETLKTAK